MLHPAPANAPLPPSAPPAEPLPPGCAGLAPLRYGYWLALERRLAKAPPGAHTALRARLAEGQARLRDDFAQAQAAALAALDQWPPAKAASAAALRQQLEAGALTAVQQALAQQARPPAKRPLRDLCQSLNEANLANQATEAPTPASGALAAAPMELKAVRQFRASWARLRTQQQIGQALERAPTQAGPINSHQLVLRSLALMHEHAPDYLAPFMAYVDTLLRLDAPATPAAPVRASSNTPARAPRRRRSS